MCHRRTATRFITTFSLPLLLLASNLACGPERATSRSESAGAANRRHGLFEDATEEAGIRFRHTNGDSGQFRFPETFGGGCAFLDYDEDGRLDALLLSPGKLDASTDSAPANLALFRNLGDGRFADVTKGSGLEKSLGYAQAVAVGDYDNDGF